MFKLELQTGRYTGLRVRSCFKHCFSFLHSCQINQFLRNLQQGCFYWCNAFAGFFFFINHDYSVLLPAYTATSLLKACRSQYWTTMANTYAPTRESRKLIVHNHKLQATITDNNHKTRDRTLRFILSLSTAVGFEFCTCFHAALTVLRQGSTPLQMFQAFFSLLWCACIQISLECLTVHVTCLEMHITSVQRCGIYCLHQGLSVWCTKAGQAGLLLAASEFKVQIQIQMSNFLNIKGHLVLLLVRLIREKIPGHDVWCQHSCFCRWVAE